MKTLRLMALVCLLCTAAAGSATLKLTFKPATDKPTDKCLALVDAFTGAISASGFIVLVSTTDAATRAFDVTIVTRDAAGQVLTVRQTIQRETAAPVTRGFIPADGEFLFASVEELKPDKPMFFYGLE